MKAFKIFDVISSYLIFGINVIFDFRINIQLYTEFYNIIFALTGERRMIEYHQIAYFIATICTLCMVTFFWLVIKTRTKGVTIYTRRTK
jgi:uncharacterized membrane protein YuzA (DUF378 family)